MDHIKLKFIYTVQFHDKVLKNDNRMSLQDKKTYQYMQFIMLS